MVLRKTPLSSSMGAGNTPTRGSASSGDASLFDRHWHRVSVLIHTTCTSIYNTMRVIIIIIIITNVFYSQNVYIHFVNLT